MQSKIRRSGRPGQLLWGGSACRGPSSSRLLQFRLPQTERRNEPRWRDADIGQEPAFIIHLMLIYKVYTYKLFIWKKLLSNTTNKIKNFKLIQLQIYSFHHNIWTFIDSHFSKDTWAGHEQTSQHALSESCMIKSFNKYNTCIVIKSHSSFFYENKNKDDEGWYLCL